MRLSFISVRSSCPVNVRFFLIDNFLLFQFCIRCRLSFTENQTSNLKTHTVLLRSDNALGTFMCLTKKKKKMCHAYLILFGLLHLAVFGIIALGKLFCSGLYQYNFFIYKQHVQMEVAFFFWLTILTIFVYIILCSASIVGHSRHSSSSKIKSLHRKVSGLFFFFYFCRWITNHSRHFFLNC